MRMKGLNKIYDYLYDKCRDLPIILSIIALVVSIISLIARVNS